MSYRQTILVLVACAGAVSIERSIWDKIVPKNVGKPLEDAGKKVAEVVSKDIPHYVVEVPEHELYKTGMEIADWEERVLIPKVVDPIYNDVLKPGYEEVSDATKEFEKEQGPLTPGSPVVTPL